MKTHFRFFLSHVKTRKNARKILFNRVLLPILLRKTRQRRGVAYDVIEELLRLILSKYFPALCHKLIYEIAILHSINRERCDKKYYNFFSPFYSRIHKKLKQLFSSFLQNIRTDIVNGAFFSIFMKVQDIFSLFHEISFFTSSNFRTSSRVTRE